MPRLLYRAKGRAKAQPTPTPTVVGVTVTTSPPSPFQIGMVYDIDFAVTMSDGSSVLNSAPGVRFSSSNAAVATVDPVTGRVSALTVGSVTISYLIGGVAGTVPLTVSSPTPTVASLTASPTALSVSDVVTSQTVTMAPRDSGGNLVTGQTVTASGHNTAVCTVAISGYTATVTYVGAGSTTITWTCGGFTATTVVTATAVGGGSSYVNLLVGTDKLFLIHPGDLTSSTQRTQIASFAAAATPAMQTFMKTYFGTYWAVRGGSINTQVNIPSNGGMEYYDGAVVRMKLAIMAGESAGGTYYTQALEIAQNYRDYLQANWVGPSTMPGLHWCLPETLMMLVLLNGDPVAKNLLDRMARWSLISTLTPNAWVTGSTNCEGRLFERVVKMCLCAHKVGLGSAQGAITTASVTYSSWLALAVKHCDNYVATQLVSGTDGNGNPLAGSFNWGHNTVSPGNSHRDGQTNFHVALVFDAVWKVHQLSPKAAYTTALSLACNYIKTYQFVPDGTSSAGAGEAFFYQSRRSDTVTPGLGGLYYNNLSDQSSASNIDIPGIFAAMFARNGDTTFAKRCIGINLANQFGSANTWCGSIGFGVRHQSDWTNTAAYVSSPSLGGYDTICKRYNEINMHIEYAA